MNGGKTDTFEFKKEGFIITAERSSIYTDGNILRICFKIISSLAERYFWIDLRCQGAANSSLFARIESAKMSKRASDKPKSRFKTYKR